MRANPPPASAPPAFLIDADREATHRPLAPDAFDNRSVVFVTDFPSAANLARHGITRALLVRTQSGTIGTDLVYALRVWAQAGVLLDVKYLAQPGPPVPLVLPRQQWWTGIGQRLSGLFGFHRNEAGDFGGFIPHPASG